MEPRDSFDPGVLALCARLHRLRPMALASLVARAVLPQDRRRIVHSRAGVAAYVDPLTNLGADLVRQGDYEPDTAALLRSQLRPGRSYLDVGANEGYFVGLAAQLVGADDLVVAVEPQSGLQDLIRINAALNGHRDALLVQGALGGPPGTSAGLHVWPLLNSGASSLHTGYRFSRHTETVRFIDPTEIFARGPDRAWVVKVDVEGFEDRVVSVLAPFLRSCLIVAILVDYHSQLNPAGMAPTHAALLDAGLRTAVGSPAAGYVLYTHPG